MLAAVHIHPAVTLPLAMGLGVWMVWYWVRLGRNAVPRSRRNIRRLSLAMMAASLPLFVAALSFLDPQVQPQRYIFAWLGAIGLVVLVMLAAVGDAMNNVRVHREEQMRELADAADDLAAALRERSQKVRREHGGTPANEGGANDSQARGERP